MLGRVNVPLAGGINGPVHMPQASFLVDGRSLHPLQRLGNVSHSGYPSVGAFPLQGPGHAPPAGALDLMFPHILTPGISAHPAVRV